MSLINVLVSTPEKLEFRQKARSYFIDVGLLPVLVNIKHENDEGDKDENLEKQLRSFYDHMDEDDEEAHEIQINLKLQLEYHYFM